MKNLIDIHTHSIASGHAFSTVLENVHYASIKGLKYYGLVEEIRTVLHKKVDVLDIAQLKDNFELTQEILKDGIKIYG